MILFDDGYGLFDDAAGNFDDGGVVNAAASVTSQQATSAIATVTAAGIQSPVITLTGQEATSATGEVTAAGDANITVTGLQATSGVSEVIALGTGSAIVTLEGVSATSAVATVSAIGQSPKKGRKSNAKFLPFTARPVTLSIDGRASVTTQTAESGFAQVTATGTHSVRANVRGVSAQTICRVPKSSGIINPSDEELIFLLAA